MKIIKRGELPQEKVHRLTCSDCKTVFECTQEELKYEYDPREPNATYYIECPVCNKYVWAG